MSNVQHAVRNETKPACSQMCVLQINMVKWCRTCSASYDRRVNANMSWLQPLWAVCRMFWSSWSSRCSLTLLRKDDVCVTHSQGMFMTPWSSLRFPLVLLPLCCTLDAQGNKKEKKKSFSLFDLLFSSDCRRIYLHQHWKCPGYYLFQGWEHIEFIQPIYKHKDIHLDAQQDDSLYL